jgi:hypothetical protein
MPAQNGYRIVGVPDGLGVLRDGRDMVVVMDHELGATQGVVRAHGSAGSFVSRWTIDRNSLQVRAGQDLVQANEVYLWNGTEYSAGTTAFDRLCSGDLPAESALRSGTRGTSARVFFSGEETDEGRAFAHIVTGDSAGQSWQLPRLGRMSWENVVAAPHSEDRTVVMLMDDANLSGMPPLCQLSIYVGTKQNTGNVVERAGLTNGKFYGIRIRRGGSIVTAETDTFGLASGVPFAGNGTFELVEIGPGGDVSGLTGAALEAEATSKQITTFRRIEDGHWEPRRNRRNDFYFVTTADINTNSRLWRLRFADVRNPLAGGTIEMLLRGDEGHRMLDNICLDTRGRILMTEDPGNNPRLAKIWLFSIETGQLIEVAHANPSFFDAAFATPMTADEEGSGIIDAEDVLGRGWFLFDVQNHRAIPAPPDTLGLVQHGQLLAMYVDPRIGRGRDADEDDN